MDKSDFLKETRILGRVETGKQPVLGQNYPNPYTSNTTIVFSIPESSIVWMDIYNTTGKKISQLLNTEIDAGEHIVQWSRLWHGEVLCAGDYTYQLNVLNSKGLHKYIRVMTVF